MGAVVDKDQMNRVLGYIAEGRKEGATIATGGSLDDAGVLRPTVITGARHDMKVCAQEVFGPVVTVASYDDLDEALQQQQAASVDALPPAARRNSRWTSSASSTSCAWASRALSRPRKA